MMSCATMSLDVTVPRYFFVQVLTSILFEFNGCKCLVIQFFDKSKGYPPEFHILMITVPGWQWR